jgi:hypothetical protein
MQGDILENIELIENLEDTKRTALDIEDKVKQAKTTETSISKAREVYRPVAARGSQLYFLVDNLNALDRCVRSDINESATSASCQLTGRVVVGVLVLVVDGGLWVSGKVDACSVVYYLHAPALR